MMLEKNALLKLWEKQKGGVVFVSAILPVTGIIVASFLEDDKNALIMLWLGLTAYQLGFLIMLGFETQKIVASKTKMKISRIRLNEAFWQEGAHYSTLYLNALNGNDFFEMIENHKIRVDHISVIAPSKKAVITFYETNLGVSDCRKAAQIMEESIRNIERNLNEQINSRYIGRIEIRRLCTFPLDFYAIFDKRRCLVGKYFQDPLRKSTIGLKSSSWIEENPRLINLYTQHFEELWASLETDHVE